MKERSRLYWMSASLIMIMALGLWWLFVGYNQSHRIALLQQQLGIQQHEIVAHIQQVQNMILWEGTTFVVLMLILGSTSLMLAFSDRKRALALQAFFASMTHELKNPIASIKLQSDTLLEPCSPLEGSSLKKVQAVRNDIQRLENRIERTLELARLENRGKVPTEPIDLVSSVKWAQSRWSNDITLECVSKKSEVTALGNEEALKTIWRNLVENSQKHSGEKRPRLKVEVFDHGSMYISSQGAPFTGSVKQLGRLFYRHRSPEGSGIGLYLVSELMRRMGGNINFEVDKKTHMFRVCLFFKKV